jgi:hypothetical protein
VKTAFNPGERCASSAPRAPKEPGIDREHVGFRILDLIELVVERAERMQPGCGYAAELRCDPCAPGFVSVGRNERNSAPLIKPCAHKDGLHARDQIERPLVGDRAAIPSKGRAVGKAP